MSHTEEEERIALYGGVMTEALTKKCGPRIDVVDAFLAAMTVAAQFCAMLDPESREALCDVVEAEFKGDVEIWAARPDARVGVTKLQ